MPYRDTYAAGITATDSDGDGVPDTTDDCPTIFNPPRRKKAYTDATELLVTADGGGSNAPRSRLWRVQLQRFVDATGLDVSVCHFPPGTARGDGERRPLAARR